MADDADDVDEARVDALLDAALAGMTEGVPAAALAELRAMLAAELLVTRAGQRLVRAAQPDPHVQSSAEVATEPESSEGSGGRETG